MTLLESVGVVVLAVQAFCTAERSEVQACCWLGGRFGMVRCWASIIEWLESAIRVLAPCCALQC